MFQASSDVNGGTVAIVYPYASLDCVVEPHTSWALPINERRVSSSLTLQAVGAEQVQKLAKFWKLSNRVDKHYTKWS